MADMVPSKFQQFNNWHFIYAIVILALLILALLTHRGYQCGDLVSVISFGATLSSIILSVLAIFMTFVSNESNHRLREGMQGLVEVPKDVRKAIDETIIQLKDETQKIRTATQENIKTQLQSNDHLKESLEKYFKHFSEMQDLNQERIDEVNKLLDSYLLERGESDITNEKIQLTLEQFTTFVSNLPQDLKQTCYLLYLISQCNDKLLYINNYIKFLKFDLVTGMSMFVTSFIFFLHCLGLISLKKGVNGNEYNVEVSSVSNMYDDYMRNHINEIITEDEKTQMCEFRDQYNNRNVNDDGTSGPN